MPGSKPHEGRNDESRVEFTQLRHKQVKSVVQDKDGSGYDLLTIVFYDGTTLQVEECGQCGWFQTNVFNP